MELRHLRYFTAVVQWKGYREASRHLYVAQPSISQAVSDLESELGIKLFSREGRVARLTPEGQVFYDEALKTLAQAERAIATAQRAARGETGRLGIGFMGFATCQFLPDLLRKYKARHPGVVLRLEENVPSGQDLAFDRGEIDIGFTRPPSADRSASYESRLLFREPLVVALPKGRKVKAKRIRIADLAGERIVTFQRASSPEVFDTIIRVCNDNGFSPRLHNELNNMHSVLSTVEAEEGVAIVSASAHNLRADNVAFYRLQPDEVRVDIVAMWRKQEPSVPLKLFLELLDEELPAIRQKMKYLER
ncbi:LysR family transcriptional regulator [Terriglobus albidus]|uniref:LysR family transcriptional regulator n=1 Tax=Terriglobus albidus TaxID=1592106 RepID=A0A5B9EJ65_9BACT|nr:LysR substrate-binding domain-containing protein [Terriglobus albidus]QEE30441.1 LysR family transcriptional regulator [Terriglobus albidus]